MVIAYIAVITTAITTATIACMEMDTILAYTEVVTAAATYMEMDTTLAFMEMAYIAATTVAIMAWVVALDGLDTIPCHTQIHTIRA